MAGDYIPGPDLDLGHWAENFISYVQEHAAEMGVDPATVNALLADQSDFGSEYEAYRAAQIAAASKLRAKNDARKRLIRRMRSVAQILQAQLGITDQQRTAMGLSMRTRRETAFTEVPRTTLIADIRIPAPYTHHIRLYAKTADGTQNARPAGAVGFEMWQAVGERPSGAEEMRYMGLKTRTSFIIDFGAQHTGETVHYMFRWIDVHGRPGPWSRIYSKLIAD